jgi:murein DD-endopeptidase MepM/ murein hydrolase activator NlpD
MRPVRDVAEGAKTLESILLRQLIQDSGAFRGMSQAGGKIYGEMFCEALANAVSQGGGIGIAKLVLGSFGTTQGDAASNLPDSLGDLIRDGSGKVPSSDAGAASDQPEVSSNYGERTDPILGTHRFHTGIDVAAQEGSPILAAASGTVRRAGLRGGYGQAVEIDNGNGISTLYGHASALAVKEGQRVSAGQPIAFVGHTGRATGSHLHFEVRDHDKPTDPKSTLNRWEERAELLVGRKP